MGLRTLVTSLATWGATVSGVHTSCDLQDIPERVGREMLPILIPILQFEMPGYGLNAFMGNAPQFRVVIDHLCLLREEEVVDAKEVLPDIITFIDAYNTAATTQKFLAVETSPANQVVMKYTVDRGVTEWGDTNFHSVIFKHEYALNL